MSRREPLVEDVQSFAQNIVDTVREPLLILDGALRVRSANRAFYQTFKVKPEETEDRLIYELGNGQWDIPALRTLLEDIIPQEAAFNDFELEHHFPTIGRRVILLNARQLRAGNHAQMLVLGMEDVTERRRIRDLEIRFTEELRESYQRLQELERLRDDLTQMIVHDLRTPLTSLMSGFRTIPFVGELNATQQEMLDIAIEGGEQLLSMINDLLDIHKLESGSLEPHYAVLGAPDLLAQAVGQVAPLAESSGLTLVSQIADDLPQLSGDEEQLRRTLVNLLGNAIKFTPGGGTVTVGARPGDDAASMLFWVRDTGEGIPPEAFGRIFEKFGQGDSSARGRTRGTGLGLTFCKLAVEAHGGRIEVQSAPGEGSTFSFVIPLAPRAAHPPCPG